MATIEAVARLDCGAFFGAARVPALRNLVAIAPPQASIAAMPVAIPCPAADQRATTGEQAGGSLRVATAVQPTGVWTTNRGA